MTVGMVEPGKPNEPPRVISPELRRSLQERYARAQSLMAQPRYAFREAHRLLAENLVIDPGNLRYIDLLLLNLKRRSEANAHPSGMARWLGSTPLGALAAAERALAAKKWSAAVQLALDALWTHGLATRVLSLLANSCAGLHLETAELRYRRATVEHSPADAEACRQFARSLQRWGRYDDAAIWWQRLSELKPGDDEAAAAVSSSQKSELSSEEVALSDHLAAHPADVEALLKLIQLRLAVRDFDDARRWLDQASAVGGGDLRVRDAWEQLSLAHSQQRLSMARDDAEQQRSENARRLLAVVSEEHARLALGIAHSRAERFPADGRLKLDLAQRLKRCGNYSGAIQRLEELKNIAGFEQVALLELGECWQHLRQFGKALEFYRLSVRCEPSTADPAILHHALYRNAVLAEALGEMPEAQERLQQLLGATGGYKDARERLDKLRLICDKNGFSAG